MNNARFFRGPAPPISRKKPWVGNGRTTAAAPRDPAVIVLVGTTNASITVGTAYLLWGYAALSAPGPTLLATGHNSAGENAASLIAPSSSLSAFGGANASLTAPSPSLEITATVTNIGSAALMPPSPLLSANGKTSGMATAYLTTTDPYKLVGYSGAVCSITLTGKATITATGTTGSIGGATLTCPLFELTASGTAQNHGSANLLAPAGRMGATAQAWLIAPAGMLTAIGHAVVTATYEAYAVNLKHSGDNPTDEVTRYTNYPFTQIVRYQNSYFGVAADGLYLLEGTTDFADPTPTSIPWAFKTCITDFDTPTKKTIVSAYFSGRLGPAATISLYVGEDSTQPYAYSTPRNDHIQNYRQVFGKGNKSRYYAIGAAGSGVLALDGIEFNIATLSRRI